MCSSHARKSKGTRIAVTPQFGARVLEERNRKELSQTKLAVLTAVSQACISHIEKGIQKSVEDQLLYRLAEALDTNASYLLDGDNEAFKSRKVSLELRRLADSIADLPEEQQEEVIEAVKWLIAWRNGR